MQPRPTPSQRIAIPTRAFKTKRAKVAQKVVDVDAHKEVAAAKKTEAQEAAEKLVCAEACVCGVIPCPMLGMKRCEICQAAGRPSIKPRVCVVRECVAARKVAVPLTLMYTGALALTDATAEE